MDDQKKAIEQDIQSYSKLKKISQAADFDEYRELVLDLTAKDVFNAFMPGKIKSWEDFIETRARVTALLLPLQEVVSADAQIKRLRDQLEQYYQ